MKKVIISAVLVLLGVLVAIAPYSFAKVCELGEKVMKCHWTARAELFTGLAIALLALLRLPAKSDGLLLGLNAGILVNSAGVILFPYALIGVCGMAKMHCHAVTRPVLLVLGILLLLTAAIDVLLLLKGRASARKN